MVQSIISDASCGPFVVISLVWGLEVPVGPDAPFASHLWDACDLKPLCEITTKRKAADAFYFQPSPMKLPAKLFMPDSSSEQVRRQQLPA
eukprot:3672429-Amphidinium_carterae.2